MKMTKWEHACLDIQAEQGRLIIDPGEYSSSLTDFANVTAVVVTHVHPDHFDPAKITAIQQQNPSVQIFTTQEVADQLKGAQVTVPEVGKEFSVGPFQLEFFGGQHASIAPQYPTNQNYGVLVNQQLYYPGDSFTPCPKPHHVLALPVMAPWLKFSETAEFMGGDSATIVFPTHNGFINADGQALYDRLVPMAAGQAKEYRFLAPGQTLELS